MMPIAPQKISIRLCEITSAIHFEAYKSVDIVMMLKDKKDIRETKYLDPCAARDLAMVGVTLHN